MRGLVGIGLSILMVATPLWAQPAPAAAPQAADPRAAEAKQRYENGMAHFNLEEWDQAIDEWKSGYRAKPVAQFLYNIAQAYRLSKHYDEALSFYQRYLRAEPKAPNRLEVEGHITKLTALLAQEKRMQNAPPTVTMAVKPKGAEGTPPGPGETVVTPSPAPVVAQVAPPSPAPEIVVTKEPERPTPVTKKKWFWPVIGVAIGVVAVAVIAGAVVGSEGGGGDNTKVLPLARF